MGKGQRRGFQEKGHPDRIEPAKQAAKWKKYLIAPILLGAAVLVARQCLVLKPDPYRSYLHEHGVADDDIKKSIASDSCQYFIVGEKSDAIAKFMNGYDDFAGATIHPIVGSDRRLRSPIIVSEGLLKETADMAIGAQDLEITDGARKTMASAAATGNPDIALMVLARMTSAAMKKGSRMEEAYKLLEGSLGSETANAFLLRTIAIRTFFDYASSKTSDFGKDSFVTVMTHETMHCMVNKAIAEKGLPKTSLYNHELLAYTGEVAYGKNPWVSLMRIMGFSKYKYISSGVVKKGLVYMPAYGDLPQKLMEAYITMFSDIDAGISIKANINNPLDLIGKTDEQLRKAAKESLAERSRLILGTDLNEVLPVDEMEKIKDAASEYANRIRR